jgi:hypothetical protein
MSIIRRRSRIGGRRFSMIPADETILGTRETSLKQTGSKSLTNDAAVKTPGGSLVAGIAVAAFGISARTNSDSSQTAHVVKAGKVITVTSSDASVVR